MLAVSSIFFSYRSHQYINMYFLEAVHDSADHADCWLHEIDYGLFPLPLLTRTS